jgi:hypothetical protein
VRHDLVVQPSALRAFAGDQGAMVGKAQVQHPPTRDQPGQAGVSAIGLELEGQARGAVGVKLAIVQNIQQVRVRFLGWEHKNTIEVCRF